MKEFNKEYLIQVITVSSNNLRLNSDKMESVALLKEFLRNSNDIENSICDLKKITEVSKLGIKLYEIMTFLKNNKVDLLTISETFKSHCHIILPLLSNSLDNISSQNFRDTLKKYSEQETKNDDSITIGLINEEHNEIVKQETDLIKEEIIFEDLAKDSEIDFDEYQRRVLKPIQSFDNLLQRMMKNNYTDDELLSYSEIMEEHKKLSEIMSLSLLSEMHATLSVTLKMLANGSLKPNEYLVENMRACLIVIVATLKNKNVDITNYLNIAEKFSEKIKNI